MSQSAVSRPCSAELRSLSTLKYEMQIIETKLRTCEPSDMRQLEAVYTYVKDRIDSISSRL